MLELMRRHSRSVVIKLLYVGIILSFVIWGFGSYQNRKSLVAVHVNDNPISFQDYQNSFDNLISYYKEQLKDNFNDDIIVKLNLKKKALDTLVDKILLLEEAKRLSLKVDKHEVSTRIQKYPAFQNKGQFDKEVYFKVLSYSRLKPRDFEKEQEEFILMEKVEGAIKKDAVILDEEVMDAFKKEKTEVNLQFIKILPKKFEKVAKSTDKMMKDYFSAHMGEFMVPEKINIGYVSFEPKTFLKEIKLTKEDYEDYYKSYIDDFTVPPKVKASHILVKFGDDREEARKKAGELLERARGGEDFAALAKKHSADTASAGKGGDLGYFSSGVMLKPFEYAAFDLQKGEISDIVETVYGFHIIKVVDIIEEKTKPLNEVKGDIRNILETEISAELAEGRTEDIYYEAIKGTGLETLAKEEKVPYKRTGLFTMGDMPDDLMDLKDDVERASTREEGWISRPIEKNGVYYIITLLKKEPPREPALDEVRNDVKAAVVREESKKAAAQKGETLLAEAKGGKSFYRLAKAAGLGVEETGYFNGTKNFIPNMGVSQEIVNRAFELTDKNPLAEGIFKIGDDIMIFRLKKRKEADMATFEEEKYFIRARLLDRRKEEFYNKWLEEARRKADISFHEDFADMRAL